MVLTQVSFFDKSNKLFMTSNCLGSINCVRWNPSGDMIASASRDEKIKLLDCKTGKVLYTGVTYDGSNYVI